MRDQLMDHVKSNKAREIERVKERELAPRFDNGKPPPFVPWLPRPKPLD
jgi:hypothetical protein